MCGSCSPMRMGRASTLMHLQKCHLSSPFHNTCQSYPSGLVDPPKQDNGTCCFGMIKFDLFSKFLFSTAGALMPLLFPWILCSSKVPITLAFRGGCCDINFAAPLPFGHWAAPRGTPWALYPWISAP